MWNRERSTVLSIVVCFIAVAMLTVLVFCGPWLVTMWFTYFRNWNEGSMDLREAQILFIGCFYPCAVFAYVTLYSLLRLLFNIRNEEIFIHKNVAYLRRISWCCFAVALITLVAGVFYHPYLMVAVAAGFVGVMLRVVKNVMQSAVEIREENELTI